jgi:hypothetical protein
MNDPTGCKNCRFFRPVEGRYGKCWKRAPLVRTVGELDVTIQPVVHMGDDCGDFEPVRRTTDAPETPE